MYERFFASIWLTYAERLGWSTGSCPGVPGMLATFAGRYSWLSKCCAVRAVKPRIEIAKIGYNHTINPCLTRAVPVTVVLFYC